MKIVGVEVAGKDGRTLVEVLHRIGRDADLALAHRIERGYSRQVDEVVLSPVESDHLLGVLDVLDDPPDGLVGLRGVLARDHRNRGVA